MRRPSAKLLKALGAGTALSLGVLSSACGSDGASNVVVEVQAENTRFVPETIEIPAGQTVTLRLKNLDPNAHDMEVRDLVPASTAGGGHGGEHEAATKNVAVHSEAKKTASVTFRTDEKGAYDVFCTIPGHEQSGMVAKLVVN